MAAPRTRPNRLATPLRARRGVEAIEFAMILPLFMIGIFMTMEFSWYMFLKQGVFDAARLGCRSAAEVDPALDDVEGTAEDAIVRELRKSGIDPDKTKVDITVTPLPTGTPPRVLCEVVMPYETLTGMFGQDDSAGSLGGMQVGADTWSGRGLLPDYLRGRSVAVFEGVP
jgi:hypothetical protein